MEVGGAGAGDESPTCAREAHLFSRRWPGTTEGFRRVTEPEGARKREQRHWAQVYELKCHVDPWGLGTGWPKAKSIRAPVTSQGGREDSIGPRRRGVAHLWGKGPQVGLGLSWAAPCQRGV